MGIGGRPPQQSGRPQSGGPQAGRSRAGPHRNVDADGGPPFPGRKLSKEEWTRTRVGLGDPGVQFNWPAAFGRDGVCRILDLGCGNGRFIVTSALSRPDCDHLGIELVPPAIRLGSLRAGQRGLTNCKFAWGDATEFILERTTPASVDEVHLYHPQPYFDAGKAARRQLTPEVLRAIHRALRPGGFFIFQTDNPAYFEYASAVMPLLFLFEPLDGPWPDAPEGRTLREFVARSRGLAIFKAKCTPLPLDDPEVKRRVDSMPAPDFDANHGRFAG